VARVHGFGFDGEPFWSAEVASGVLDDSKGVALKHMARDARGRSSEDEAPARWNSGALWFLAVVAGLALLLCVVWGPQHAAAGGYVLTHSYVGEDFFSKWSFFVGGDPTHGTVKFLSFQNASMQGLIHASFDRVFMGTDASEVLLPGEGRKTVRIESNEWFRNGLFVLDLDHAPWGCGSWPAFWMFGEDAQHAWPRWGEYDIVESVHNRTWAATTLHTRKDCAQTDVSRTRDFNGQGWVPGSYGTNKAKNCFVQAPGEFANQGCGQEQPYGSWGRPLNQAGGGTWAAEWDPENEYIRTWFFPRGKVPADLTEKRPLPDSWGMPTSFFSLKQDDCSARHFRRMRMVFDITFCGEFGSATFGASCASTGQSCEEYVQKNPAAFSEAFWSIRTLDVYKRSSEAEGVSSAETGLNYGTPPNGPNGALRSVGILCLVLGVGGCGATAYFMYKKGAAENASFVDIQKEGLSTFSANLQTTDVSQCTHVNLRELEQAEFVTQIRENLPTVPQVSNWFQGTSRPVASHPQRNPGAAAAQPQEQGAASWAGFSFQPSRGDLAGAASSRAGSQPAAPVPGLTGTIAATWPSMTSWLPDMQPTSTRQPSLGRTSSSSSGQQVCVWPAATQPYVRGAASPQQGRNPAAETQAAGTSAGGWSNWQFGAAQTYSQGSPSHGAWRLPPTINALGPGGSQRRT